MSLNYYILPNSLTIVVSGKTYHIADDSPRYKEAVKAIEDGKEDLIMDLIDPTLRLGVEGFTVKDGLVHYKETVLPAVIGDQLVQYKVHSQSFLGLVNFWLNLKFRVDFEQAKKNVIAMMGMNSYPLTQDGFVIVYDGFYKRIRKEEDFILPDDATALKKENVGEFPFYSYATVSPKIRELFEKRMTLDQICMEIFGFHSKKLNKLVLEQILNKTEQKINQSVFGYGLIFKGVLSNDNLFRVMENKTLSPYMAFNENMAEFANKFLKNFTEKKLLNWFTKEYDQKSASSMISALNYIISYYKTLEEKNVIIHYSSYQSFEDLAEYVKQEITKLNHPLYPLNQEEHFKALKKITEFDVNSDLKIVVPQTSHDLLYWSQTMMNCIYTHYSKGAAKGEWMLLGVVRKEDNTVIYNIEIRDKRIQQFSKESNRGVSPEAQKPILEFLVKNGLIKVK